MKWCLVNRIQIIFHSSIFYFLLAHVFFPQQWEETLSLAAEFSSWSPMIGFQIDDCVLSVCWGLWFPGESRLTVSQIQCEYSVVHSGDLGTLLTLSSFGELQVCSNSVTDSTSLTPSLSQCHDIYILDPVCCNIISHVSSQWLSFYHCQLVNNCLF